MIFSSLVNDGGAVISVTGDGLRGLLSGSTCDSAEEDSCRDFCSYIADSICTLASSLVVVSGGTSLSLSPMFMRDGDNEWSADSNSRRSSRLLAIVR